MTNSIKKLRRERGISAEWLAKELSIGVQSLSRYENGKRQPRAETLQKMSAIFNCTIEALLAESE